MAHVYNQISSSLNSTGKMEEEDRQGERQNTGNGLGGGMDRKKMLILFCPGQD